MLIFFPLFFSCLRFVLYARMICLSLRFVLLLFVNENGDCGCGMVIVVKCFWVFTLIKPKMFTVNLLELWVFKWVIFELCLDFEKFTIGLDEKFD